MACRGSNRPLTMVTPHLATSYKPPNRLVRQALAGEKGIVLLGNKKALGGPALNSESLAAVFPDAELSGRCLKFAAIDSLH